MSVALQFKLTQVGQTAVWNASNTGISLNLTHIQFGSGNRAPSGTETALLTPQQAVAIAAGFSVSSTQIRMSAIFTGNQNYVIREVGLWAGDPAVAGSKLVGYWSQAAGDLAMKSPGVDFIFSHDMTLDSAVPAGSLTILADNAQSAMLAMMAAHESAADPHVQYATKLLVRNNGLCYATGTGTGNIYAATYTPAVTALADGMVLEFKAANANTGAATFSPNGLTAKPIVGGAHSALQGGEIVAGGMVELMWHAALNSWVLLGCTGGALQVGTGTQSQHAVTLAQAQSLAAASATASNQLYFMGQL